LAARFELAGGSSWPSSRKQTPRGGSVIDLGGLPGDIESGANAINDAGEVVGYSAFPEPSTWAMMLLGFSGLGFAGYRRVRIAGVKS
jgi:PEP-CTERM motif